MALPNLDFLVPTSRHGCFLSLSPPHLAPSLPPSRPTSSFSRAGINGGFFSSLNSSLFSRCPRCVCNHCLCCPWLDRLDLDLQRQCPWIEELEGQTFHCATCYKGPAWARPSNYGTILTAMRVTTTTTATMNTTAQMAMESVAVISISTVTTVKTTGLQVLWMVPRSFPRLSSHRREVLNHFLKVSISSLIDTLIQPRSTLAPHSKH